MKRATIVHDQINLVVLPILGALTVAGLCELVDPVKVTALFIVYILADFVWIFLEPEAVPSLPNVILFHHVVTLVLLSFPMRYHHLAVYTCWDGICEINTFFLIAKRQWKSLRKPFSVLFWATFIPMRTFLYPYMLVEFYREMQVHARWEMLAVCGSQVILIGFNAMLLGLSIMNWKKRAGKSNAGVSGKEKEDLLSPTEGKGKGAVTRRQKVIKASTPP